ncbi:MAG: hypothetical protein AAF483_10920 [Planctomycetota bacterium]
MQIDQAIFTSSQRGRIQGYQLVAKSTGIDAGLSQKLSRWCPSQLPEGDPDQVIWSAFPLGETHFGLARSFCAGPEYSRRGEKRIMTRIAVLREEHFEAFEQDYSKLIHTLAGLGYLRLPLEFSSKLPVLQLPPTPFFALPSRAPGKERASSDIIASLQQGHRCAWIGDDSPLARIAEWTPALSQDCRRRLSFSTGLALSQHRPFQIHFLPQLDASTTSALQRRSIELWNHN